MRTRQQATNQQQDPQPGAKADGILRVPPEYRVAAGTTSPLREKLAQAATYAGDAGAYETPIRRCIAALLEADKASYDTADAWWMMCNLQSQMLQQQSQGLRGQQGAAAKYLNERHAEITSAVTLQGAEAAGKVIEEVKASFGALDTALAGGRRSASFISLSAKMSGDEIARAGLFEKEVRAQGITERFLDALSSAAEAAEKDAAALPEAKLFALCGAAVARDELAMSPQHRQFRSGQGGTREQRADDALAKSNALCRKVLAVSDQVRELLIDPALLLASDVRTKLLGPAARLALGTTSWDFPAAKFDALMATNGGGVPDELEALEGWWAKNLPRARDNMKADALTIERRGGARGPMGWGMRRRTSVGYERVQATNLVDDGRFAGRV